MKQEQMDNRLVIYLIGEIDTYTAPKLRETLIPLTEEQGKEIVIDLTEVNYIDSTGLGIFIGALKSSHNYHSHLKLQGLSNRVQRLFHITGLDEVIDIEKREEAK